MKTKYILLLIVSAGLISRSNAQHSQTIHGTEILFNGPIEKGQISNVEYSKMSTSVIDTPKPKGRLLPNDFNLDFDPIAKKIVGIKQRIHNANVKDSFDRIFQFTVFPPIGTNYKLSSQDNNNLSLNLFAGYNGGVKGLEVGGFVNLIERNVSGVQAAGFVNVVGGNTNGLQAAGLFNHNKGKTRGIQCAGISNINLSDVNGVQAAGFSNYNKKTFRGMQMAGYGNFSTNVNGAQFSGFINVADTIKGLQLGFINIARHVDGVQLGLFNYAKNGIHQLELNSSDVSAISIGVRSGTKAFYTGFTIGLGRDLSNSLWHYGFSAGTQIYTFKKLSANFEITSSQWTKDIHIKYLNLLNRAELMAQYQMNPKLAIAFGPAWNVWIHNNKHQNEHFAYVKNMPMPKYSTTSGNFSIKQWLGWKVALRFF